VEEASTLYERDVHSKDRVREKGKSDGSPRLARPLQTKPICATISTWERGGRIGLHGGEKGDRSQKTAIQRKESTYRYAKEKREGGSLGLHVTREENAACAAGEFRSNCMRCKCQCHSNMFFSYEAGQRGVRGGKRERPPG